MKHLKLVLLSCLLVMAIMLGAISLNSGSAKASSVASTWKVVASPNGSYSYLNGVAGISSNDVWAVGSQIQHWDGSNWKLASPNLSSTQSLYAVATVSSTDAWAVGNDVNGNLPLAEQWNGSQWDSVAIPNPPNSGGAILKGVVSVSANDIWAAGSYFSNASNTSLSLIEHWNGSQWSVVASPNPSNGENVELYGVSASSQNNVWAVGTYLDPKSGSYKGLIESWNGTAWKISAKLAAPDLTGVIAISATDVWAVGGTFGKGVEQTLTEHWNGQKWSIVASSNPSGSLGSVLSSVTHIPGSNQLWAVGTFQNKKSGQNETLTELNN